MALSPQYFINSLLAASTWALIGVSFALIFRVGKFFHFAHGMVFTIGAYSTFMFVDRLDMPLLAAIPAGVVSSMIFGVIIESAVYRPLRQRGSRPLVLLLASLGIYIVLQNAISCLFGDDTKSIRFARVAEGIDILGARITPVQIFTVGASVILMLLVAVLLRKTTFGRAIRAIANDQELATISGVATNGVFFWTFAFGSALAGIAGILVALDVDITPGMGMNALLMGIVAAIIGGMGRILGVAFGALLLGMAQHIGVIWLPTQWQNAIAFIILVVFLLFRPEGFFGRRPGKVAV